MKYISLYVEIRNNISAICSEKWVKENCNILFYLWNLIDEDIPIKIYLRYFKVSTFKFVFDAFIFFLKTLRAST